MAGTQGSYLVIRSVNDANALLTQLEQVRQSVTRITERMAALGAGVLDGYEWPNDYTQADFIALYQALDALPGSILADDTRDKILKLVSSIQ